MSQTKLLVAIGVLLLSSCAALPASEADAMEASIPLTCRGAEQCGLYWRRAQVWVATNAPMKLQIATDVLIETHTPPENTQRRAFRVVREPGTAGVERILIASACTGYIACRDNTASVVAAFKRYVRSSE